MVWVIVEISSSQIILQIKIILMLKSDLHIFLLHFGQQSVSSFITANFQQDRVWVFPLYQRIAPNGSCQRGSIKKKKKNCHSETLEFTETRWKHTCMSQVGDAVSHTTSDGHFMFQVPFPSSFFNLKIRVLYVSLWAVYTLPTFKYNIAIYCRCLCKCQPIPRQVS